MTDEAIEKQVISHGYEKVVNKVKEEKERYQKLHEVIKNKVPYFILFETLISKIESIHKRIEQTKEEERIKKQQEVEKERQRQNQILEDERKEKEIKRKEKEQLEKIKQGFRDAGFNV